MKSMADLVSLSKRRGFVFQSSEVYGGLSSCYDYGPLGVELKNNIKNRWWKTMTLREDVVGIDASIFMHPQVWKASGHVDGFNDPMVDCKQCKSRYRADQIDTSKPCPACGSKDTFTEPRDFNLMFKTQMGPVEDSSSTVYMRPETAQGIFVNFLNVQSTMRMKLPFGIAQIGKAFRNEITPGNFVFRMREFEQMEMQYFLKPGTQMESFEKWREIRWQWHIDNGLRADRIRWKQHGPDELAHYADAAWDIEYQFAHGWGEMEGIHSRTDFDLTQHEKFSGKSLSYVDQMDGNKKYVPYVVETSVGADRCFLAVMSDAYRLENEGQGDSERVVMKFHPKLAPVKTAILPLMKKPELEDVARKLYDDVSSDYMSEYDVSGSIGKRYRRQDEIGTPFCMTVDYDSLTDQSVTIRDRDTMKQERINVSQVKNYLKDHFKF
ncbi:MAG: glycine--tRNA ligase [Bdellovibrio sp. CG12_big_fil_rev_8_21_14_0_65_39_13]|nr:MAG: glycine--tRNA ligase [Bdellovibrio sp. CG22_combo_CG10-13_8_21_14_all_39_27]PIQ58310.1 MAG: glycine--tRNA ligase [Bdellovibrio sp. CG12_big_fil_rev_8_21_14_0_65_39_13]PIR35167.1 MAG: glycine--tRNA ligase [Bdellovibrio sp. CG11_big_fil_rev_8_21_14_0_20_39_38]